MLLFCVYTHPVQRLCACAVNWARRLPSAKQRLPHKGKAWNWGYILCAFLYYHTTYLPTKSIVKWTSPFERKYCTCNIIYIYYICIIHNNVKHMRNCFTNVFTRSCMFLIYMFHIRKTHVKLLHCKCALKHHMMAGQTEEIYWSLFWQHCFRKQNLENTIQNLLF